MRTHWHWDADLQLALVTLLVMCPVVIATVAVHRAFKGGAVISLILVLLALWALGARLSSRHS